MDPTFHENMANIIYSNFPSRISQTTWKEIEKKNYYLLDALIQSH